MSSKKLFVRSSERLYLSTWSIAQSLNHNLQVNIFVNHVEQ